MPKPSPSWKARRRCAPHQLGPPRSLISTRSPRCTAQRSTMRQSLDQAAAAGVKATLTSRPESAAQQLLALPPEPPLSKRGHNPTSASGRTGKCRLTRSCRSVRPRSCCPRDSVASFGRAVLCPDGDSTSGVVSLAWSTSIPTGGARNAESGALAVVSVHGGESPGGTADPAFEFTRASGPAPR